jgi:hypothetical protein
MKLFQQLWRCGQQKQYVFLQLDVTNVLGSVLSRQLHQLMSCFP